MGGISVPRQNGTNQSPNSTRGDESPSILVVSNRPDVCSDLHSRLSASRWNVEDAPSGAEALEKLASRNFHVLMLEPVLPDLSVGDFREILDSLYPHLQIVALNPRTGQPMASPTAMLGMEIVELIDGQGPVRQLPILVRQRRAVAMQDCEASSAIRQKCRKCILSRGWYRRAIRQF